jgi:GTP-binding protein HflX
VDRLEPDAADAAVLRQRLLWHGDTHEAVRAVALSAKTGEGVDRLLTAIDEVLPLDLLVRTRLEISAGDGATLALLHEFGRVIDVRYEGDRVEIDAEIPESLERRLKG